MFRFAKTAAALGGRSVRQQQVRHGSTAPQDFHSKFGLGLLVGGSVFCVSVWSYVLTQTGIVWNLSPVKRLKPKPWRDAE